MGITIAIIIIIRLCLVACTCGCELVVCPKPSPPCTSDHAGSRDYGEQRRRFVDGPNS